MNLLKFLLISIIIIINYCSPKGEELNMYDGTRIESRYADALSGAKSETKRVLLIFGADWCGDCNALDRLLEDPKVKSILESKYKIMKIDIGRFDKNMEFASKFDNPTQKGIPALVILDSSEKILISTNNGYFSKARTMPVDTLIKFLELYSGN
jgi:thioredoxin-related protein